MTRRVHEESVFMYIYQDAYIPVARIHITSQGMYCASKCTVDPRHKLFRFLHGSPIGVCHMIIATEVSLTNEQVELANETTRRDRQALDYVRF